MPKSTTLATFELEDGTQLQNVPVAYETWGQLNEARDNVIVVCHALTGNTDVPAWWGPLLGPGRALDTDQFFVICANVPGSPYGTISPLTSNPATQQPYGPDFPAFTIRDTVRLHRKLLEQMGVRQVVSVVGGSMGGMQTLEWAFFDDYVRSIVPVAVGGRHSAWCIGWSEAQRQAIYSDPRWHDGRYEADNPPVDGLTTARMMAMVSYRSRASFQQRFGRERMDDDRPVGTPYFAVESYLHYQGERLVDRFDANCYVKLTQQMDTHDVARGRGSYPEVLASIEQPTLVIGIDSDVLYPLEEQQELAEHIPNAELAVIESPHGHDAFLIEMDDLNELIDSWMHRHLSCPSCVPASL